MTAFFSDGNFNHNAGVLIMTSEEVNEGRGQSVQTSRKVPFNYSHFMESLLLRRKNI